MKMNSKRLKFSILCVLIVGILSVDGLDTNVAQTTSPAVENEDEAAAFKRFEDKILSLMKNVRRQVFPFLTRAAYDVALSPACTKTLMKLYNDLISLKSWALKMLDSSGKIPSGLLKGSMVMLGNYDECLEIVEPPGKSSKDPEVLGRYCLTFLYVPQTLLLHLREFSAGRIRNTSSTERFKELFDLMSRYKFDGTVIHLRFGVCIPSTCSEGDLSNILKYALSDSGMTAEIRSCQIKENYIFTVEQIIILFVFVLITTVVVAATVCDYCLSMNGDSSEKRPRFRDRRYVQVLLNFSATSNMKKLFSDDVEDEKYINIPCLRGLAVILFCFYMVVNSYAIIDEHALRSFSSSINYFSMLKEPLFAIIANSMIFVDTLFGIAGFLLFHAPFTISKANIKAGVLKSIFRYVLPLLTAIGVFLLLPLFGDGPAFQEVLGVPLSVCRRNWWTNILFFNNFLKLENQCMLHTWFLGCLIQLLLIGLVFKWMISRWPKIGLGSLAFLTVACNVYLGIIAVQEDLPPAMSMYFIFSIKAVKRVTETIFFLPHGHIGSFAVGMCTSYWIQQNHNVTIRGVWKFVGRITVVGLLCCLVFGLYPYHDGTQMNRAALALYSSLHGIVFGAIVSLALIISLRSDSDIVSQALSSKYFLPLRKLVYHAYLLHWPVIFFHIAIARERQYLGHYEQMSRSFGHIIASFFLAFIFHILFNGIFTLDEVATAAASRESSSENTENASSCFKSVFARKRFEIQKPTVYGVSEEFAMQSSKDVPE